MNIKFLAFAALAAATAIALADDLPLMTHAELQAVNPDGSSTQAWTNGVPFAIRGILLNDPAEMVSPVYVAGATNASMGGQFQVFVQAFGGDRGGTAVFMSQYNRQSHASYTETEWSNELARVTVDPDTGHRFQPGDCVEVTARRALHYNGKVNINEAHNISPDCDFDIRLVTPGVGLPPAEPVTLRDLVVLAGDGTQTQIFDPSRAAGGEHWQGMRVRLDAIRLADTDAVDTWNHPHPETLPFGARLVTCTDATGRTFPLRLPRRSLGPAPATNRWFSATGFINQEGSNTAGYELVVQEVGPVLDIAFEPATEDEGAPSAAVLTYSADYAGYQLQVSDDSGATWHAPALAFPTEITVRDAEASPTRFYRLVLPAAAASFTNMYDASQSATLPAGAQQAGGTLKYRPVVPGSVVVRLDRIALADNGNGVLGDNEGTVNYESGAWTIKLKNAWWSSQQSIKINYSYYVSNSEGVE